MLYLCKSFSALVLEEERKPTAEVSKMTGQHVQWWTALS